MALILMIVAALPLGFLIRNRLAAFVAYTAAHAFVFTFQSIGLVIDWAGGDEAAFGPFPQADDEAYWGYGAVNLVIYAVALGLVYLGSRLGTSGRARAAGPVHLDPVGTRG